MPKNHFSAKGIKQPRISDIANVIRREKKAQLRECREGLRPRSPIIRSQVNSRNSCRRRHRCHRRRRCLRTATLVKRQKPLVDVPHVLSMRNARLAYKSSIRRNIDSEPHFLASPRATHNSRRRRHFSSTRKRRELVTKAREFIIVCYTVMCICTSLTRSFNHLSLDRAT